MLGVNKEGGTETRSGKEGLIRTMRFWFSFQVSWSGGEGKIHNGGRERWASSER